MGLIGQKVKKLRFQAKKTQREIAELLGISIPALSKIEADITDVNTYRVMQFATLFEVHPSWFFIDEREADAQLSERRELESELVKLQKTLAELQDKLIRSMEENNELMRTFMRF